MDSSDESFAWTSASSASEDSDRMLDKTMNGDMHDESDSGKSYKRKLQKQLFTEPSAVSPARSRVKREAASDACEASGEELDRVKQEKCTPTPRKKKKRRETDSQTITEYEDEMTVEETPTKRKLSQCSDEKTTLTRLVKEEDTRKSKSKKLKTKKELEATDYNEEEMIIEDKITVEDTIVQTRNRNNEDNDNSKTKNAYSSKEFISDESSSDENSENVDIKVNCHKKLASSNNNHASTETAGSDSDNLANGIRKNVLTPTTTTTTKASHKTSKLSDRIQFEDEEDLIHNNINNNDSIDNNVWSSRFKRFLRSRSHLKSIPQIQHESLITNDDEIWVLKCPREMDIMSLGNTDILLDNKCKIKIDGKTFIGSIDKEVNRVAILSFEHSKAVINNMSSTGTVCFRKRIPKSHFIEESITANNKTSFIPLPDTKCRHPLFGSNYKRAMKIPTLIRARLKAIDTEPVAPSPKTKKKKKHKKEPEEAGSAREPRATKRQADEEPVQPPPKKKKRSRHHSLAAEAWDSEKAIEENLFNF